MKRILVLGGLASLLAVSAAAAGKAPGTLYSGALADDPDSEVVVKVLERGGEPIVGRFAAKDFSVDCDGGAVVGLRRAKLAGRIEIGNRGGFREKNTEGDTVFKLRGELDGRKAKGRFRYSGQVEDADGVTHDGCDSGRLKWKARANE